MASAPRSIDISDSPDLLRLVDEVQEANEPLMLRRGERVVAEVRPISPRRPRATPEENIEAFRSAAGSWADLDVDEFMERVHASRKLATPTG